MSRRPAAPAWVVRGGLVVLALPSAVIAAWGLIAPRSFYDDFPGAGRHWVSALPPYNEHLLRDFAAASLAIVVFLIGAAIVLERRTIQVALIAFLAYSLPHLAYHLTTTDHYSSSDNVGSLGGFVITIALACFLLVLTRQAAPVKADRGSG
ncbi:MAG: hypothetical protein ACRDK1_07545 [Solirubrobacterales bacterium]